MTRYLVRLEYDGAAFKGFQRQPGLPTVQGALEAAIVTYSGEETRVMGAGRTDAGVHALGMPAAFDLPRMVEPAKMLAGLNALLPDAAAVLDVRSVPADFDPRREALWREYRYFILNRKPHSPLLDRCSHHVSQPLDLGWMREACGALPGTHDFGAFSIRGEQGSRTREVLECGVDVAAPGLICFRIRANAFLYRMVRIIGGALVRVGRGKMTVTEFMTNLEGGSSPCAEALPPHGLFLWTVEYPSERLA